MFAPRTAAGLTVALLALPATATARPMPPSTDSSGGGEPASLSDYYGWGQTQVKTNPRPYENYYGAAGLPPSSLAGTTSRQDLRSPDAADAARAGDIAKAMEHYQRS